MDLLTYLEVIRLLLTFENVEFLGSISIYYVRTNLFLQLNFTGF